MFIKQEKIVKTDIFLLFSMTESMKYDRIKY